jgi:hypothetical protein
VAVTYSKAIELVATREGLDWDLGHSYLQIFPDSLRVEIEPVRRLAIWHNKWIREMCRVTMLQTHVYRILSESLQKRTVVFSLEQNLASRTLLWARHVARMHKSRLPKRLVLSWIPEPRVGGQEMTYGLPVASTPPGPLQPKAFTD